MFFFPSRGSVFELGKRFVSGEEGLGLWGLGMRLEDVVPVVLCGTKTADRRIESDHLFRHGVARGIRIKAAI